jgi:uncharacterized protein YdeI (YjbR/CyaY-like superfamily)
MTQPAELTVPDAAGWRAWLEAHHLQPEGVWVVIAKVGKTAPTTLSMGEAQEEAACFGWVDSQTARRDSATYLLRFTPRRSRTRWSESNIRLAERLMGEGRMHPHGLAEVERARRYGRWAVDAGGQGFSTSRASSR